MKNEEGEKRMNTSHTIRESPQGGILNKEQSNPKRKSYQLAANRNFATGTQTTSHGMGTYFHDREAERRIA